MDIDWTLDDAAQLAISEEEFRMAWVCGRGLLCGG